MVRIGDYTHGLVLLLQFGYLYSMTLKDFFSKSFIEDGFCISNKQAPNQCNLCLGRSVDF